MEQGTKRTVAVVLIASIGAVMGVLAAAEFNLAGVILTTSGFDVAYFWEPLEGSITTAFGCLLLLGWVISLVILIVTGRSTQRRFRRTHWVGIFAILLSIILVGSALSVAGIVLPAQYEWALY